MDSHAQLARRTVNTATLGDNSAEAEEQDVPAENPLLVIHRLMVGRYIITILLGVIIGGMGAFVARKYVKDKYSSVGTLRVQPTGQKVIFDTDQNGDIPMYRAYVDMQTSLLSSEKVLDLAAQDPDWVEYAGPAGPESSGALAGGLKASHDSDSQLITVTFTDPLKDKCTVAVRAIINAYLKLYNQDDAQARDAQSQKLTEVKNQYQEQYQELKEKALGIAREFGSSNLDPIVASKEAAYEDFLRSIRAVNISILAIRSMSGQSSSPGATTRPMQAATAEQLSLSDGILSQYLEKRRNLKNELEGMQRRGLLDNNASMMAQHDEIDNLEAAIKERTDLLNRNMGAGGVPGVTVPGNLPALLQQKEALQKQADVAEAEWHHVGQKNLELQDLQQKMADRQQYLAETKNKLEAMRVESGTPGRIDVISFGDRPQLQSSKRKLVTAAAGGGGVLFTFAAVLGFQFFNRKMRHVADIMPETAVRKLRLLGAIPTLPDDDAALLDNTIAAQAVHRVRARLQIEASAADQRVLAITSPAAGNGKSCVTTALGISFASSGSRVLLIDCDLVGGGLTARLKARVRHNVVDLLRRRTPITEEQLAQAGRVAKKNPNRFVKALVELNFLDCTTVNEVVMECNNSNLGILDALNGELISHCIGQTAWPKLFIMPRGLATAADSNRVSPSALRRLLQQARGEFDIILIDTGPIFGSIEASMAACEADGTILVVTRGESRVGVHGAISELNSVRARLIGAIFNRAKDRDVNSYGMTSISRLTSYPMPPMLEHGGTVVDVVAAPPSSVRERDSSVHETLLDVSTELS